MVNTNEAIETNEVIVCYVTNIAASTAFGIDIDCLAEKNSNHSFLKA